MNPVQQYLASLTLTQFPVLTDARDRKAVAAFYHAVFTGPAYDIKRDGTPVYEWHADTKLWRETPSHVYTWAMLLREALEYLMSSNPDNMKVLCTLREDLDLFQYRNQMYRVWREKYQSVSIRNPDRPPCLDPSRDLAVNVFKPRLDKVSNKLPLLDGTVVDIDSGEVVPRGPEHHFSYVVRAHWDMALNNNNKAPGPMLRFLQQLTCQQPALLRELLLTLGHRIGEDGHMMRTTICHGVGSGKSTLFELLDKLFSSVVLRVPDGKKHRLSHVELHEASAKEIMAWEGKVGFILVDKLPADFNGGHDFTYLPFQAQFLREVEVETDSVYKCRPNILTELSTSTALDELFHLLVRARRYGV